MKKLFLLVVGLSNLLLAGCADIARDLAEEPYRKAMTQGRMSPSEYRQQEEAIRQASQPTK